MLEEMIEGLVPLAEKDRSARAYMQLLASLKMARASKREILEELANMEFYHQLIKTKVESDVN